MPKVDVFDDKNQHLQAFTNEILRDLARNDSAPRDYRRAAVEVLVNRKHHYAKHEDLRDLVYELEIELDGIVFEHIAPSGPGPLTAGVTTQTLYGVDVPDEIELLSPPIREENVRLINSITNARVPESSFQRDYSDDEPKFTGFDEVGFSPTNPKEPTDAPDVKT